MAKVLLRDWKDRLASIVMRKLGTSLDQVLEVDEERLADYWREGLSPMEYFQEYLAESAEVEKISLALEL